jgi:hypothetical protein
MQPPEQVVAPVQRPPQGDRHARSNRGAIAGVPRPHSQWTSPGNSTLSRGFSTYGPRRGVGPNRAERPRGQRVDLGPSRPGNDLPAGGRRMLDGYPGPDSRPHSGQYGGHAVDAGSACDPDAPPAYRPNLNPVPANRWEPSLGGPPQQPTSPRRSRRTPQNSLPSANVSCQPYFDLDEGLYKYPDGRDQV